MALSALAATSARASDGTNCLRSSMHGTGSETEAGPSEADMISLAQLHPRPEASPAPAASNSLPRAASAAAGVKYNVVTVSQEGKHCKCFWVGPDHVKAHPEVIVRSTRL